MQGYCVINVILSISVTTVNLISIKLIICKQRYFLANIYQLERFICRKFAQSSFNNLNNRLLTPHNGLDQKMLEDGERLRSSRDRYQSAQHHILQRVGIEILIIYTAIFNILTALLLIQTLIQRNSYVLFYNFSHHITTK